MYENRIKRQKLTERAKNILKTVIGIVVAAVLLYFSFRGIAWDEFIGALKSCNIVWVAVSMTAGVGVLLVRGARWKLLLEPIDPSTSIRTTFNATNICMGVNLALPRVGEFVRIGFITRRSKRGEDGMPLASYDKVLGSVVGERVWDMLSVLILTLTVIPLMWSRTRVFFEESLFKGLGGRLGGVFVLAGTVAVGAVAVLLVYKYRDRRGVDKVWRFFAGIWTGITESLKLRRGWLFVVYTIIIWGLYWITSLTVLYALQGMDTAGLSPELCSAVDTMRSLTAADALFLMIAGALSSIIPVPGGFGAFHTIVSVALLTVYGIPYQFGLIFATLSHESEALVYLVTSLGSYADESIRPV